MSHIMYMSLAVADSARNGGLQEPRTRANQYGRAGTEPSMRDLLSDPLTHAVMARDKVSFNDLQAVVNKARETLRARKAAA